MEQCFLHLCVLVHIDTLFDTNKNIGSVPAELCRSRSRDHWITRTMKYDIKTRWSQCTRFGRKLRKAQVCYSEFRLSNRHTHTHMEFRLWHELSTQECYNHKNTFQLFEIFMFFFYNAQHNICAVVI